jgi:mannose-6-phosphate isomerase-like protein (cupin superfamily)
MTMNKLMTGLVFGALIGTATVSVRAQQPARGQQPANPGPPRETLTKSRMVGHDKIDGCSAKARGTFINTPEYMVQCSNRIEPGVVEIHKKETDIIYVVDGSATFVTDGTPVGVTAADTDQPRAKSIQGGVEHHLVKGDVIAVPAGVPHWFKEVPKTSVAYYVIKVLKP